MQAMQVSLILNIRVTSDLYEIVVSIFIEISAITNFSSIQIILCVLSKIHFNL